MEKCKDCNGTGKAPQPDWGKHVDKGSGATHYAADDCDPSNAMTDPKDFYDRIDELLSPNADDETPDERVRNYRTLVLHDSELDPIIEKIVLAHTEAVNDAYLSHFSYDDWETGDDNKLRLGDYVNLNHQHPYDGHEQNITAKIVPHYLNNLPVFKTEPDTDEGEYWDIQAVMMDGWTFNRINQLRSK